MEGIATHMGILYPFRRKHRGQARLFFGFPLNLKNIGEEHTAVNHSRTLEGLREVWGACVVKTSVYADVGAHAW